MRMCPDVYGFMDVLWNSYVYIYIYYYIIYRENYGHIWTLDKSREDISKYKLSREDTYIIYIQKYLSVSRNIHKYPSVSYIYIYIYGYVWCEEYETGDSMDSMDQRWSCQKEWQRKHEFTKETKNSKNSTWHEHDMNSYTWTLLIGMQVSAFYVFQLLSRLDTGQNLARHLEDNVLAIYGWMPLSPSREVLFNPAEKQIAGQLEEV